jgi:hypothetical protein
VLGLLGACTSLAVEEPAPQVQATDPPSTEPSETTEPPDDYREGLRESIADRPSTFLMIATATDRSTGEESMSSAAVKSDDGRLLKVNVEIAEGRVLMDYVAGAMYIQRPGSNIAMKLDMSAAENRLERFCLALEPDAEVVERETIAGIPCWVVRTENYQGEEATLWVSRESGLTKRMETEQLVVTYAYMPPDWTDREFELPEDVEVRDMLTE